MHRIRGPSIALFVTLAAAGAGAQSGDKPVRVRLEGPADCSSSNDFLAAVSEHLKVHAARADEAAVTLAVRIEKTTTGYRGTLDSAALAGSGQHEFDARSCQDVVAALALTAALALESSEPTTEKAPARVASDAPPPTPSSVVVTEKKPADAPAVLQKPTTPSSEHQWGLSVGAAASGLFGPLVVGPTLGVTGWWDSHFRWLGRATYQFDIDSSSRPLDLSIASLGGGLCADFASGPFRPALCAVTDVGFALGRGTEVLDARTAVVGFGSSGFEARVVASWENWFIEPAAGASLVWLRPRFLASNPDRTLGSAELVTWNAFLSVGRLL